MSATAVSAASVHRSDWKRRGEVGAEAKAKQWEEEAEEGRGRRNRRRRTTYPAEGSLGNTCIKI